MILDIFVSFIYIYLAAEPLKGAAVSGTGLCFSRAVFSANAARENSQGSRLQAFL